MKQYAIRRLNKHALADRHYLLHAREAEWEEVDRQEAVLDTTGLSKLRIVCSNCGCVLTQDSSCEFIRDALRCPDCGEKFFHVSRMVRAATPAARRVETPAERRAATPAARRAATPEIPLPPVSAHPRSESASVSARERERAEAIRSYGYSDDMGMFKLLDFTCRKGFKGRATRREFWLVQLALTLILIVLALIICSKGMAESILLRGVVLGFSAASFKAYFCVLVRRLHDVGKSGWWCFLAPVPFVYLQILLFIVLSFFYLFSPWLALPLLVLAFFGFYIHLILPLRDSQHGTNKYGPSYKYPD